jgi:hypothetical protein
LVAFGLFYLAIGLAATPPAQAQVPSCAGQPAWFYGPIYWQHITTGPYRRCGTLVSYTTPTNGHYEQDACEYRSSPGQFSCTLEILLSNPSPHGRCPNCSGGGGGGGGGDGRGIGQGGGFGGPGGGSPGGIYNYCDKQPQAAICRKVSK